MWENKDKNEKKQNMGLWGKLYIKIISVLLLLGLILLAILGIKGAFKHDSSKITAMTVENRFGSIAELATYEYSYTLVETYEDAKPFFDLFDIPFTTKKIVVIAEGKIKAGFSLDDVKPEVDEEAKTIRIKLPEPEILDHYLEIIKCIENNNIFNPISVDETNNLLKKEKAEKLKEAKEKGIFEKATEKMKETIKTMYADIKDYKIIIE